VKPRGHEEHGAHASARPGGAQLASNDALIAAKPHPQLAESTPGGGSPAGSTGVNAPSVTADVAAARGATAGDGPPTSLVHAKNTAKLDTLAKRNVR
jgi:hypothetical protein